MFFLSFYLSSILAGLGAAMVYVVLLWSSQSFISSSSPIQRSSFLFNFVSSVLRIGLIGGFFFYILRTAYLSSILTLFSFVVCSWILLLYRRT